MTQNDALKAIALGLPLVLAAGSALAQNAESATYPWEGAWQWLDERQDGRLILTDQFYCGVFGDKDRSVPNGEQLSEAEAANLFRSMPGPMCGTVTVSVTGDQAWDLETEAEISASPRGVGTRATRPTTVDGDQMTGENVDADGNVRATFLYRRLSGLGGESSLAGVWRLASDEWDGMMILTDSRYRYVVTQASRPEITSRTSELSDADAAALYHSYDAQGGEYSISGSRLVRTPTIAKNPQQIGRENSVEMGLNGDTLMIWNSETPDTWRRIDSF